MASNGVKWVTKKRAQKAAQSQKNNNPRKHHYIHYSDIKPENQNDNFNNSNTITQQELIENLNEWKFHFVISQVKTLVCFRKKK